jgi:ribosomal protein RSM22 (predicted rRNA methylase)
MPHLEHATLFEKDIELLRLGQHLTQSSLDPLQLTWCRDNIQDIEAFPPHDAVVLSYVLNELPSNIQLYVLARAFRAADKLLILIEPGTPQGFGNLLKARQLLTKLGAQCIAPCPHNGPCPLAPHFHEKKDWCHFSVRIPRGKYHRLAKDADLPFEDEKYAYLVVSPHKTSSPKKRVIKAPIQKSGHVILDLCTDEGELSRTTVSKSKGTAYKAAKDLNWGDEWEEVKK